MRTAKISAFALAALLLSGCNGSSQAGQTAPQTSTQTTVQTTVTAASQTAAVTTASETTAASSAGTASASSAPAPQTSSETTSSPETSAETDSEPSPASDDAIKRIWACGSLADERALLTLTNENNEKYIELSPYASAYSTDDECDFFAFESDGEIIGTGENDNEYIVKYDVFNTHSAVRESSRVFSFDDLESAAARAEAMPMIPRESYVPGYDITWDDVYLKAETAEDTRYTDLSLGYKVNEPLYVLALVCDSEDGKISVLIDPGEMLGLPMFTNGCTRYSFGGNVVLSDSLLFEAEPVEGLSLDTAGYAYAEVSLLDAQCRWSLTEGYDNTCTIADISMVQPFDTLTKFEGTRSDRILFEAGGYPNRIAYFVAATDVMDELVTDKTVGMRLCDLDFDEEPELLVTSLNNESDVWWEWSLTTDIYRYEGDEEDKTLRLIGSVPVKYTISDSCRGYWLGLVYTEDGSPAWHVTINTEESEGIDSLFTLDGDELNFIYLFEERFTDGEYCFMGEPIVPEENEDGSLTWNGITVETGMIHDLFAKIRQEYCLENVTGSVCLCDSLFSNILTDSRVANMFKLDENELYRGIAKIVIDHFTGADSAYLHKYSFLH